MAGAAGTGGVAGAGGVPNTGGVIGSGGATSAGGAAGIADSGVSFGCAACEAAVCAPQGVGCDSLTATARTTCDAALSCIRRRHCAIDGDTSFCYCGTANQDDGSCASAPLGACVTELEAADPNIQPADTVTARFDKIAADLVDPSLPIGRATDLIACDALSCNTPGQCAGMF